MEGLFLYLDGQEKADARTNSGMALLGKHDNLEIIMQNVVKGATVWLSPGGADHFEMFFVHSGYMEMILEGGYPQLLKPGDSFHVRGLKQNVMMRCREDAQLLYVSTDPVYNTEAYWQQELRQLLNRINRYDQRTENHSKSVMRYAVRLYDCLREYCSGINLNDFIIGTLFHDVGKCNIPAEILLKKGRLTPDEYRIVQEHPTHSAGILRPMYGAAIAQLAYEHHERMDGSGYPRGLKGEEILFEARILGVADSFDAMTSNRGYNRTLSPLEAAQELVEMQDKYDPRITAALLSMVEDGSLWQTEEHALGRTGELAEPEPFNEV